MDTLKQNFSVEKREGKSHGLRDPLPYDSPEFKKEMNDTLEVSQIVKSQLVPTVREMMESLKMQAEGDYNNHWPWRVQSILHDYSPVEYDIHRIGPLVTDLLYEMGFFSFKDLANFVEDDQCVEYFTRLMKALTKRGYARKDNRDFIKGACTGDYSRFMDRLEYTMQKVFDEKYHRDRVRPVFLLTEMLGLDASCFEMYHNPDHPEDPAGHGGNNYESAQTAHSVFKFDDEVSLVIWVASWWLAAARSFALVHWLNSNARSIALATRDKGDQYRK